MKTTQSCRKADLSRSRANERGSTLFEAAFITLPFLIFLMAIFEFGLISRAELTISNSATEGSRAASVFGEERDADFQTLATINHGIRAVGVDNIEYVVIFRANNFGAPMNSACHTSSVALPDPNPCNRYTAADFELPYFEMDGVTETAHWGCGPTAVDRAWCPADRQVSLSGPLDVVGVYVKTKHYFITRFFGSTRVVEDFSYAQIEPEDN